MRNPQTIIITGASSGLGAALARDYAAPGIFLGLTGRDAERLEQIAAECRADGASVATAVLDVRDQAGMKAWLSALDAERPVDLIIANAGISAGTGSGGEADAQVREIFAANVDGVFNTIQSLIPAMRARGRGQIALMASLASFRGLAGAPAYCASKAAVRVYGEGLRGDLMESGVTVSVICPGYVKTPMTDVNDFPMIGLMSAEKAVGIIRRGLAKGRARIAFPWRTYALVRLISVLPASWVDRIAARMPRKPAKIEK